MIIVFLGIMLDEDGPFVLRQADSLALSAGVEEGSANIAHKGRRVEYR
jgi:hypothetical protein